MRYRAADNYGTRGQVIRGIVTWSGMAVLGVVACVLSQPRASGMMHPPSPEVVHLTGTIRDFEKTHVDFNVVPSGGYGHYAMNVAFDLGVEDRPTFRGTGFRVDTQWRDTVSNPIAPHLYGGGVGLVRVANTPTFENQPVVDTFDSSEGPYDPDTAGPAPTFYVGAEMPTVDEPTGLPPLVDQLVYDANHGTTTIANDIHCNKFLVSNHHTILIDGNVTILCEQEFKFQNHAHLELLPGATLTLYTKGVLTIQDQVDMNMNTADPSRFVIYNLGTEPVILQNQVEGYATVVSPNAQMLVQDGSDFYGTFTGQSLHVKNQGGFHLDGAMPFDECGVQLNDTMGAAGIPSTGGVSSAATYDEWYRDVLGTNLSIPHTIDLVWNGTFYEFASNDFYPIDGQLFGNEGDTHNNYFTFTFTAYFIYEACDDQFFEFMGSDDAWLFIDQSLAIDLGGIIPSTDQHVDLDRLGLVDGESYAMQFFYAHRNPTQAIFRVRTNVPLIGTEAESVNAGFD
ncbi:MAG: fibro-slime domain-containing protein [Phycisphaerales bacterium]